MNVRLKRQTANLSASREYPSVPVLIHELQAQALPPYYLRKESGSFSGFQPEQKLVYRFDHEGVHINSKDGPWGWSMRLSAFGTPQQLLPVDGAEMISAKNRVEYRHQQLTEWYLNGPLGLEHGVTIHAEPSFDGARTHFVLEFELAGDLKPVHYAEQETIRFVDANEQCILECAQLYVTDAYGVELPAQFQAAGEGSEQRIRIAFDATHATYPITVDPLIQKIEDYTANDGSTGDKFGYSVAVSGTTAVIGAPNTTTGKGAVYVFTQNTAGSWILQQKVTPSDGATGDNFGFSVAIDQDTIVAGAPHASISGTSDVGAAYIFTRSGNTWSQQQKLYDPDYRTGDGFGWSVGISGNRAVVGSRLAVGSDPYEGAVYCYSRSGSTWTQQQRLRAGDMGDNDFGYSLAIRGNKLIVGASGFDAPVVTQGAAYIYTHDGTNWGSRVDLTLTNGQTGDHFGTAVAVSPNGKFVMVGCPGRDTMYGNSAGSAYVYENTSGTTWVQRAELIPTQSKANGQCGLSVAISDTAALVGAPYLDSKGKALYYVKSGTNWKFNSVVDNPTSSTNDEFAMGLAMTSSDVVIGIPGRTSSKGGAQLTTKGTPKSPNAKGKSSYPLGTCNAMAKSGGSPVVLDSGEKQETITDLHLTTANGAFDFTRTYLQNEQVRYQFMGLGWTHNHNVSLTKIAGMPNQIVVRWDTGAEAYFTETTTDHYDGLPGFPSSIEWNGNTNRYTLSAMDHSTLIFDDQGRVLSRTWSNGDSWTYTYSGSQLSEVSDGYGREFVFRYYTSGSFNGQLFRVGDHTFDDTDPDNPTGRYVEFGYINNRVVNASGAIVAGTLALLHTVRDVRGNVWSYGYYGQASHQEDVRQLNYLITITSPSIDTTGDGSADAPITVKELTYTLQGVELAVNGSMELTTDWTNIAGAAPTINQRSSTQVYAGTYSRRVVTNSANKGIEGVPWSLTAGLTYIVTAHVYVVSGAVKMQVSEETAFDRVSSSTGSWETLRVVYSASADAVNRKLQFISSGGASEFYVDSVSIVETNAALVGLQQALGNSASTLTYEFLPDGANRSTETIAGKTANYWFDNGTHAGSEDAAGNTSVFRLNSQYRPTLQEDANGNQSSMVWNSNGKLLNSVTNAAGQQTTFTYYTSGQSVDALKDSTDVEGRKTSYIYGDSNHPRLPTEVQVLDTNGVTVLRWQKFSYDSQGRTLTEKTVKPDDDTVALQQVTRTYYSTGNGNGLLESVTQVDVENSGNNNTTTYTYDAAGRVVKTQQSSLFGSCQISYTVFDAAGNVVASICNYENTGAAPETAAQAVALYNSAYPDKNRVTTHEYDAVGRRVKSTTNAGASYAQTTITVYDGLSRVVRTISNYVTDVAIPHPYTAAHSAFSHGVDNNQNLVADTLYNERGMVRKQVDVLGNVTLYGYDDAGRLIKTIQSANQPNYNNDYVGTLPDPELENYIVNIGADRDIVTTNLYDPVGNLVKTVDALSHTLFTVYDVLNRPVKTVRNASNPTYDVLADKTLAQYVYSSAIDRDFVEVTDYDAMGRVKRSQDVSGQWTLYGYDPLGRQVRVVRHASNPTYDSVADPDLSGYSPIADADQDRITDTVYDIQGRVLYTVDLSGEKTWTAYDGLGRQIKTVVNAVGTATDGGVNDPRSSSYVESSEPDRDLISKTYYDSDGRVQWTQDALGRKTWYVYDSLGRQKKIIRNCTYVSGTPAPEDDAYVGQHASDSAKDVISKTLYDDQGRMFAAVDARGNEMRYEYDVLGRRTKTITNYVDGVFNANAPDEDLIETTEYDLAGRVVKSVNNAGRETRYEYDLLGRQVKTMVNYEDGTYSTSQPDRDLISTTTYNKGGQVVLTTDARGTQTAFEYDDAGRRIKTTQAANTPLATTSYTCYDKAGRVLRVIQNYVATPQDPAPDAKDINGNFLFAPITHGLADDQNLITSYTLDKLGRQTAITDAMGSVTSTVYREDGQTLSTVDPEGMVSYFAYDRLRRRTTVVQGYQSNGEDPALWVWDSTDARWEKSTGTAIGHGARNDQNVIVRVTYDKSGRMLTRRDPRGNLTTYEYDLLDRRTKLTNPLSQAWQTAYADVSGGKTRVTLTDPLMYQTQRDFDKAGRLTAVQYLSESPKLTPNVTFSYDAAGNRVTMSESDSSTTVRETIYTYDQARRLTAVGFDHDGNGSIDETVSYEYDAGGLRTELTLPGGLNITYTYDAKGQLTRLSDWNTPQAQTTRFDYDRVGRLRTTERANGLRSQYTVDAGGRLRRLRHHAGNRTLADFVYTVDKRGNRTEAAELVARAGSGTTTLNKDHAAVEVVRGAWVNSGDFKTSVNTTAALKLAFSGDTLNLTMGTGADHSLFDLYIDHSYWDSIDGYAASDGEQVIPILLTDDGAHVLEIRNRREKNGDSTGYRVRFKQLEVNRQYDLHLWAYTYDALARVATATLSPTGNPALTPLRAYQYAFDLAGNRLSETVTVNGGAPTVTSYTYNAANQISSAGFSYDANGNLTSDGTNTYTWDRVNRLLSMGGSSYAYDGVGNRVSQTVGTDVTRYLLDVQPGLAVVLSATTGMDVTRYVHSLRGIHAQQDSVGNWEWMVNDGLGSVRGVAGNNLSVLESRLLDPYGNVISGTGTNQTRYHFTGEPRDLNGLQYHRARYYNSALGMFPSLDPFEGLVGRPMSLNGYDWVEGNAINGIDRTGLIYEMPDQWSGCLSIAHKYNAQVPPPTSSCTLAAYTQRIAAYARQEANQEVGQLFPTAAAIALAEIHVLNKGNTPRSRSSTYSPSTRYIDAMTSSRILNLASAFVQGSCSSSLVQRVAEQLDAFPELTEYQLDLEFIAQNPTMAYQHSFKSNNRSDNATSGDPFGRSPFERLGSPIITNIDRQEEAFKFRVFRGPITSVIVSNDFNPVPLEWNCLFSENRVINTNFNPNLYSNPDFVSNSSCVASCNKNLWWWKPPTTDNAREYATIIYPSFNPQYNDGDAWIKIPNDNGTNQDYQSVINRIGGSGHVASCS